MGQGSKNKTIFKLPIEITLVIKWVSTYVFPSLFYFSMLIRCIVFIGSAKIPESKGSILPTRFYGQLPDY